MCVILICKRQRPTLEILEKCHDRNNDGAGIAWFDDTDQAKYKKGFNDPEKVFEFTQKLKLPFIVHFRWASIGGRTDMLTHPFEVTSNSELKLEGQSHKLLFQNGTVSTWDMYLAAAGIDVPIGPVSDSRALAMIISKHGNSKFLTKLPDSRFIVMDAIDRRFYIYGSFTEENGIAYSNMFWKNGASKKKGCQTYCPGNSQVTYNNYSGHSQANNNNNNNLTNPVIPNNANPPFAANVVNVLGQLTKKDLKKLKRKLLKRNEKLLQSDLISNPPTIIKHNAPNSNTNTGHSPNTIPLPPPVKITSNNSSQVNKRFFLCSVPKSAAVTSLM